MVKYIYYFKNKILISNIVNTIFKLTFIEKLKIEHLHYFHAYE